MDLPLNICSYLQLPTVIVSKVAQPPDQFGIWEEMLPREHQNGCVGSDSQA